MPKKVKAVVLTGFGLNCDVETAHAFELAGAEAHRVHINTLIRGEVNLDQFHILAFGGGFSWGDDHGAGVIQALKLKNHLGEKLQSFVAQKKLIIGICNGFQTLVNIGLLPGINQDYETRSVALTWNDCGNFRDQWVHLTANADSPCIFTQGLDHFELPVRHAQGKFVADGEILDKLIKTNQVVLRYADRSGQSANQAFPLNPNGSVDDIAGICDATGHIFGLMPHPEAFNHFTNHPHWATLKEKKQRGTSLSEEERQLINEGVTPGLKIFMNAVAYMAKMGSISQ